jgi:sugar lactone lactonase YvrE
MPAALSARTLNEGDNLPNGLAFTADGDILIANIGRGALERLTQFGSLSTICDQIDGNPLGMVNFVLVDNSGRVWVTVTTRVTPWPRAVNDRLPDGFIARLDEDKLAIVADGFVGTNEIRFDEDEQWMYVVESHARRISRLRLKADGHFSSREIYGPPDLGGIPDGMAFDLEGNLWITLVNADRLIALTPEGDVHVLLDDGDATGLASFEEHYARRTVTPEILSACRGTIAPLMSSVTFGGDDLQTVYLGSLMGTAIASFRSPIPGLPLAHWKASPRASTLATVTQEGSSE